MTKCWIVIYLILIMNTIGDCLKCFDCESTENPACGVYFKAYQYEPQSCTEAENAKCGLQRQPKTAAAGALNHGFPSFLSSVQPQHHFRPQLFSHLDGRIHILRACYYMGQWPGMNESDGCHFITLRPNVTLEFCLCTDDLCNTSTILVANLFIVISCASVLGTISKFIT